MKFLSVCSGIEAASVAWNPLGWKAVAFSEIEPFPCALLKQHYPDTPNWGDMTKFKEWPDVSIDLLCGGTPCQSFSVAGLRKGLDDPRGNLMLTFGAIAAKYRPKWLVWENVPGVLSSNGGRDFGAFLGMLGQLGYGFAYRVLDAQYFGVAQRRRRVFVVGCLGDWRSAAAVLFERHSLQGHPAPSRQAGQAVTPTIRAGAANGGAGHGARSGDSKDELIVPVAGTMKACKDSGGWSNSADHAAAGYMVPVETLCVATGQAGAEIGAEMAPTLNCNHEAPYVAHSLRGEGFDASEDGTGRGTLLVPVGVRDCAPMIGANYGKQPDSSDTSAGPMLIPMAYATKLHNTASNQSGKFYENYTASLDANSPPPAIVFDTTQITSAANYSNPMPGDPCHPLAAQAHVPCIAFPERMSGTQCASTEELAPSMGATNPTAVAVSLRGREGGATAELGDEVGNCLRASGGGGDKAHVLASMAVRRLTPVECERLQGFPDDYTAVPNRGKPAADGPRYKALGNSWAVPNVRWIGRRINDVAAIKHQHEKAA